MQIEAAAITLQERQFVVAVVRMELVKSPSEADMAIETLQPQFGGVPVVLVAQTDNGSPVYYGDRDLVQLLADVPLEKMPWKEYSIS